MAATVKAEDVDELSADVDPQTTQLSGETGTPTAERALRELPMPVELLALAATYVQAAHELRPTISNGTSWTSGSHAKLSRHAASEMQVDALIEEEEDNKPDGEDLADSWDQERTYLDCLAAYRRYLTAAVACCWAVVRLEGLDVRMHLRARLVLAEILVRETNEYERADDLITKGLSMASQWLFCCFQSTLSDGRNHKHESLADYRFQFLYLQAEKSLACGNTRFARQSVRKIISELGKDHPLLVSWWYRFQLLYIEICQDYERDYNNSKHAVDVLITAARGYGHLHLHWALLVLKSRLALLKGDLVVARETLMDLAADLHLPVKEEDVPQNPSRASAYLLDTKHVDPEMAHLPNALILQFLVLFSIYQLQDGQIKSARHAIRRAQHLLDDKTPQAGCYDDHVTLDVGLPKDGPHRQTLAIAILPRAVFYAYTFLISTMVQLDPLGADPKCLRFALAGLHRLDMRNKLDEEELNHHPGSLTGIETMVRQIAAMRIDLMLVLGELLLMRSDIEGVHEILLDLVAFSRSQNVWDLYAPRILALQAMFVGFLGRLDDAILLYKAGLELVNPQSQLGIVIRASLLLVRIAQGNRIALSSDTAHVNNSDTSNGYSSTHSQNLDELEDLAGLAKGILQDCKGKTPALVDLELLVGALVDGRISETKRLLQIAFDRATKDNNHHLKALIMALLATCFTHTRSEQANKMLLSSLSICKTMGGAAEKRRQQNGEHVESTKPALYSHVGLAELGLWVGQRVQFYYESNNMLDKIEKQRRTNSRFLEALEAQRRFAAAYV